MKSFTYSLKVWLTGVVAGSLLFYLTGHYYVAPITAGAWLYKFPV